MTDTCGWCGFGLEERDHLPCRVEADELRRYAAELEARCDRRDLEVAEQREALEQRKERTHEAITLGFRLLHQRNEARALARSMWAEAMEHAETGKGCSEAYPRDTAKAYPWMRIAGVDTDA